MQEVTGYKTEDGKLFESKEEALCHEREQAFKDWFNEGLYYGSLGYSCDAERFTYFLKENRYKVGVYLGFIEE